MRKPRLWVQFRLAQREQSNSTRDHTRVLWRPKWLCTHVYTYVSIQFDASRVSLMMCLAKSTHCMSYFTTTKRSLSFYSTQECKYKELCFFIAIIRNGHRANDFQRSGGSPAAICVCLAYKFNAVVGKRSVFAGYQLLVVVHMPM